MCVSVSMCVYMSERGGMGGVCFENCNNWFRGFCIFINVSLPLYCFSVILFKRKITILPLKITFLGEKT